MDFSEALQEVEDIGFGYFYDDAGQYTDEEIVARIQQDIRRTQQRALHHWERTRDAFQLALDKFSEKDWRKFSVMFGHTLYDIDRIRGLFTQLYEAMTRTIEDRKMTG